jgi:CRISPR-associated protein Cmr2
MVNWVCVPSGESGYRDQWHRAHELLSARRRVRDFQWVEWHQRALCSLGPRWPAEDNVPPGLRPYEQATLSAAGWVKRQWRRIRDQEGFPSTASIASAPFRRAVAERLGNDQVQAAVSDLRRAAERLSAAAPGTGGRETPVPGLPEQGSWLVTSAGPWVYPERWQADSLAREAKASLDAVRQAAGDGYAAASRLRDCMKELDVPAVADYLAVIVQDVDSMGRFLRGDGPNAADSRIDVTPDAHRGVSASLQELAERQRRTLRSGDLLGVPVYAGGDDLLAFVPAVTALAAARRCHDAMPADLPTASTAVLFFHYHVGLQSAVSTARGLLKQAKDRVPGKHALAVGYLRRSGVSEASVQPWGPDGSSADAFGIFTAGQGQRLSPRLIADLDRDADELAALSTAPGTYYRAELARLVRRHTEGEGAQARDRAAQAAAALERLGKNEAAERLTREIPGSRPQLAARVGVFLRQEAR